MEKNEPRTTSHDLAAHTFNCISFCAGIGGLELGLARAVGPSYRTICVVERDVHAASTLVARMQDGSLCDAPVWSDVKTFDPRPWHGLVDVVTAGYPCQPFSLAGRRKGEHDPRHLWPHIAGHIGIMRPRYVFCENVASHLSLGFDQVCDDLRAMGYSVAAGIFTALEVGARHIRKRLFFVAHADSCGRPKGSATHSILGGKAHHTPSFGAKVQRGIGDDNIVRRTSKKPHLADADGSRELQSKRGERSLKRWASDGGRREYTWEAEPNVGRVVDGLPLRLDRIRALGNAVVPQVSQHAWRVLTAALGEANG